MPPQSFPVGQAPWETQGASQNGNPPQSFPVGQAPWETQSPAQPSPSPQQHDDLLNNPLTRAIQAIFPGKEIGQSIGTLGGYGLAAAQDFVNHMHGIPTSFAKNYDLSSPTPAQTAGDAAAAVATPLLGSAEGIASNAALGGATALGNHIATGDTNPTNALEAGAAGALGAGALSGLGDVFSSALAKLPTRIAQKALSGATPETANYALENAQLGPISKIVADSKAATESGSNQIDAALSHPDNASKTVTINDFMPKFSQTLPNTGMDENQLQSAITRLLPTQKTVIQKLFTDGLPLKQTNALRSQLDNVVKAVYINGKKVDTPAVAQSKQIGAAFAGALRQTVKENAPETIPMFAKLQQEINLRNALQTTQNKLDKRVPVGLYDILSGIGGLTASGGNPGGAALAIAAEKAARSPGVQLGTAKVASKVLPATTKAVGTAVAAAKGPVIKAASQ